VLSLVAVVSLPAAVPVVVVALSILVLLRAELGCGRRCRARLMMVTEMVEVGVCQPTVVMVEVRWD
jgi:hypothetical protein